MTQGIIDRFEGDWAILEIEELLSPVKRAAIPPEAREGDVLVLENNQWHIDHQATARLKDEIQKLAEEVWE